MTDQFEDDNDEKVTRPATLRDLLALIDMLNRHEVPYMLIGGFSMIAHGFSRSTRDIDILFPADATTGEKVKQVLVLLPQAAAKELDPDWFSEGENIRVSDEYTIDIMLNANGETYESLLPYRQIMSIEGIEVSIPSLEGMLKTKLTDREKDKIDQLFLKRHLNNEKEIVESGKPSLIERMMRALKIPPSTGIHSKTSNSSKEDPNNEDLNPDSNIKPKRPKF